MIEVHDVSKRFGRLSALDHVSLRIARGERVALIGSNGSGKTTLLRALCGLLRTEGRIELNGVDVQRAPARALSALSYIPQVAPPLEAPVKELVRTYLALRGLAHAEVAARAARMQLDLEAISNSRVRDLSGGMKQKLLAALALATNAPILVCDEPTASLDSEARAAFFELVDERGGDAVLVLCSHRLDEIRQRVDRVIELKEGKIVCDERLFEPGSRDELCSVVPLHPLARGHERARSTP